MRIQVAIPEAHVTKPILDAALEGVTRLNEALIRSGNVPPYDQTKEGLQWQPEPPGQEHFDHAGIVVDRGWGDCDDLAPYKAASDRVTGKDPGAHAVVKRSGPKRWHAIVEHTDRSTSDPSLECGMPGPARNVGIAGATLPVMFERAHGVGGAYIETPQLALRPVWERHGRPEDWQARADLPWHWQPGKSAADVAMVSLHKTPVSDQALVGACQGAIILGRASGFARPEHIDRLEALCDACEGAAWEELAADYGEQHADAVEQILGSWFGKLTKKISRAVKHPTRLLKPLATQALPFAASFIPGAGPVAHMALQAASPALQHLIKSGRHKNPKRRRHVHLTSPPIETRDELLRAWERWQM
jgi:hypothetical protein